MDVKRTGIILKPSNSRVVIRPFEIASESRVEKIVARISSLSEPEVEGLLEEVMREFRERHQRTREFLLHRFDQVRRHLLTDGPVNESRRLLIGSYFTQEYALESAALFNPSMVWHPDQSGLPEGSRRFIVSLRATGEGHISSITFRSGVIDGENRIRMDEPTRFVVAPDPVPRSTAVRGPAPDSRRRSSSASAAPATVSVSGRGMSTRRSTSRSSERKPHTPSTYCRGSPASRRASMASKNPTARRPAGRSRPSWYSAPS